MRRIADRISYSSRHFNPLTYVRWDSTQKHTVQIANQFQSTHLCKVRPKGGILTRPTVFDFNPLTYVRWDSILGVKNDSQIQFQSTHLCKVRPDETLLIKMAKEFQSTHLCKVRRNISAIRSCLLGFQSTHLCKVRHKRVTTNYNPKAISIHSPM